MEKIRAEYDLRILDLMRVAFHADGNKFAQYRSDLVRKINPMAGVDIIVVGG